MPEEQPHSLASGDDATTEPTTAEGGPAIYSGMTWERDTQGRPQLVALSDLHPLVYLIDMASQLRDGTTRCQLYLVASDDAQIDLETPLPHLPLGTFRRPEDAVDAAEVHDWGFFQSLTIADGEEPAFQGSRREAPLDPDELSALQAYAASAVDAGGMTVADGRPFTRAASFVRAKKTALKQNANGSMTISLEIGRGEMPIWLQDAPLSELLMLGVVSMGQASDPEGAEFAKYLKDLKRRTQMRPGEPAFQEFMAARYDKWGLVKTALDKDSDAVEEAVAETLRRAIGVPTRAELDTNRDARERFERLDREFYADMSRALQKYDALADR
ncbi:hypothetical protein CKO28_13690 [Rhodovibrio sodomensis]|uniref:Uncharacterized protein n=1 Tax=Rhodovibrio sodomensis TaxID=1088 RepID=A0ABS1DGH4_9PROT|nr:hypothetical protein [Rhodovibrio sodomensis]MBK1669086.1 hypothetical protein [Rhodovibrio sodomensis]